MRHKGIYLLKKGEKELKYTWGGCKIAGGFNLLRSVEDIETQGFHTLVNQRIGLGLAEAGVQVVCMIGIFDDHHVCRHSVSSRNFLLYQRDEGVHQRPAVRRWKNVIKLRSG